MGLFKKRDPDEVKVENKQLKNIKRRLTRAEKRLTALELTVKVLKREP